MDTGTPGSKVDVAARCGAGSVPTEAKPRFVTLYVGSPLTAEKVTLETTEVAAWLTRLLNEAQGQSFTLECEETTAEGDPVDAD